MSKRLTALFIIVCMLLLAGCQLAKPDAQQTRNTDMLVGVFITTEYLDLHTSGETPTPFAGQIPGLPAGSNESDSDNRIYAAYTEETTDTGTVAAYRFEGLEGILVACYLVKPEGGQLETFWRSDTTEGISDVVIAHHTKDDGEEHSITGTIYFSPEYADPCLFFNPVYQTADGDLYIVPGEGMAFDACFGGSAKHTLNGSATYMENGQSQRFASFTEITMEYVDYAKNIRIIRMNENNQILSVADYTADSCPDEINVDAETAYLLVEEYTSGGIRRTLYQPGDDYITVFKTLENKLCIKKQLKILWPQ